MVTQRKYDVETYIYLPWARWRVRAMTRIYDVYEIGLFFFKFLCPKKQVSGVGGLASLAKRDSWQVRVRLTLTYHVIFVNKC